MSGAELKAGTFSLSDLGVYGFWSRETAGATPEDRAAAANGTLSPERHEQLTTAGLIARDELMAMAVPGVRDWMSPTRRVN